MRVFHLFAGIGGGIIASKILGDRIVGACEIEPFCQRLLRAKQTTGILEDFPIYDDVRKFKGDEYRGLVDCICGGFPCQDISSAGKGAGIEGKKSSLFFELARIVSEIRPRYVFLENSPLLVSRGLDRVLGTLSEIGYDAEWSTLSAGELGAPHKRERFWAVCQDQNASSEISPKELVRQIESRFERIRETWNWRYSGLSQTEQTTYATHVRQQDFVSGGSAPNWSSPLRCSASHSLSVGEDRTRSNQSVRLGKTLRNSRDYPKNQGGEMGDSEGAGSTSENNQYAMEQSIARPLFTSYDHGNDSQSVSGWWEIEPSMDRVVNEFPHWMDAIRGLGNAQVPIVAVTAFYLLLQRFIED